MPKVCIPIYCIIIYQRSVRKPGALKGKECFNGRMRTQVIDVLMHP